MSSSSTTYFPFSHDEFDDEVGHAAGAVDGFPDDGDNEYSDCDGDLDDCEDQDSDAELLAWAEEKGQHIHGQEDGAHSDFGGTDVSMPTSDELTSQSDEYTPPSLIRKHYTTRSSSGRPMRRQVSMLVVTCTTHVSCSLS
jgi:hypothetical protein